MVDTLREADSPLDKGPRPWSTGRVRLPISPADLLLIPHRELVVFHHSLTADSGTVSWDAIRRFHVEENGWSDIGYHFGIERVGAGVELQLGRSLLFSAAAVREERMNLRAAHVCVVGNFDLAPPAADIWDAVVLVATILVRTFGLGAKDIRGHRDFAPYKTCPGALFDLERLRHDVATSLTK